MLTGCSLWTKKEDTTAKGGVYYFFASESWCMKSCLAASDCVAIDVSVFGCTIHSGADKLITVFASGSTQFVLNRHCMITLTQSTEMTSTRRGNVTDSSGTKLINYTVSQKLGKIIFVITSPNSHQL